jgi:ketosteroid isomerase-like protein
MSEIVIDHRSGERGGIDDWMRRFEWGWAAPAERLEDLLGLLAEDVVLKAPTWPSVTRGKAAGRDAFRSALAAAPDLRAEIARWRGSGDTLFIEMVFHASLAGKPVSWRGVDRILFVNGEAIERIAFFEDSSIVVRSALKSPRGWAQLLRLLRYPAQKQ